jgi:hypothetical protein
MPQEPLLIGACSAAVKLVGEPLRRPPAAAVQFGPRAAPPEMLAAGFADGLLTAIEIRMRASRRMDQMRQEQKATIGLAKGGTPYKSTGVGRTPVEKMPTLADAGISKNLAKEGRKLGSLSDREFEKAVTIARESVGRVIKHALSQDDKAERRSGRERDLAKKITALPDIKAGVIVADPEWRTRSLTTTERQ